MKSIKSLAYQVKIGNIYENIYSKKNMPMQKCRNILKNDVIGTLGYGPQGRAQSLNLRDNGFNVILGLRKGNSWNAAIQDKWEPGHNLFEISNAAKKSNIIQYLLSDAGQIELWPEINPYLTTGKTLYFSHGFGIVYTKQTGIIVPPNIDVVLAAPKGPGIKLREKFVESNGKHGVNTSIAVHQNWSGRAAKRVLALAFGIGSHHVFETTFKREVYSDLTGERCVLMGLIQAAFKAQYDVLRANNHSPIEAFNETVEEALQSLYPIINQQGMDWMFRNCSTTAQRGAIDWSHKFEKVLKPVIEECYKSVKTGKETKRVIANNSNKNYRKNLEHELNEIDNQEIWQVGKIVRELR